MYNGEQCERIKAWIVENAPPPKEAAVFYPYQFVFRGAFGFDDPKNGGNVIREGIEEELYSLFADNGIGVQLGVKSNGRRGIRIINLR